MRLLLAGAVALLVACGGGTDDTLTLGSGDISESDFRDAVRAAFARNAPDPDELCPNLQGLSPSEAADLILEIQPNDDIVQEANRDDQERAAEILQEECGRILD